MSLLMAFVLGPPMPEKKGLSTLWNLGMKPAFEPEEWKPKKTVLDFTKPGWSLGMRGRLAKLRSSGERSRQLALFDMRTYKKQRNIDGEDGTEQKANGVRGEGHHFVSWAFPTVFARGGDLVTGGHRPGHSPDLKNVKEAVAVALDKTFRLVELFGLAANTMSSYSEKAPFHLMDEDFGRKPIGRGDEGPVDAFRLRCSATLFAVVAHKHNLPLLRAATLRVLKHFTGDLLYDAGIPGFAGYTGDPEKDRNVLKGPDEETLRLLGNVQWPVIEAAAQKEALLARQEDMDAAAAAGEPGKRQHERLGTDLGFVQWQRLVGKADPSEL